MKSGHLDLAVALWALAFAVLFALQPAVAMLLPERALSAARLAEELQTAARGVYLVVVVLCLASAALRLVRSLGKPDRMY